MYLCWDARPGRQPRRELTAASRTELRQAASGERHSLLLLSDGTVHSCGDNSHGQLGRRGVSRVERPGERQDTDAGCGTRQVGALGVLGSLGPEEMGNDAPRFVSATSSVSFSRRALVCFGFQFLFKVKLKEKL